LWWQSHRPGRAGVRPPTDRKETRVHPHQHRIDLCNQALEAVRPAIPSDLCSEVHDYINRFGEWGLGMELLIDRLCDTRVRITPEQFALTQAAMDSMDLGESSRVAYLREHSVDS
jgi:hypothetical protein